MIALSSRSRTTSISYSFQPSTDSSISTSVVGLASSPPVDDRDELLAIIGDAAAGPAQGEARPDDRRQADQLERRHGVIDVVGDRASAGFPARSGPSPRGTSAGPRPSRSPRRRRRSSCTPYLASVPSLNNASAVLSAVCPPMVGSTASGRSFAMIAATIFGRDRLDIGGVGQLRIGHDRRRVRIDQDDPIALLLQRLAPPACPNNRTRTPGR